LILQSLIWLTMHGCASTKSLAPQKSDSLETLKKSALDEYESVNVPRFSKSAISDAEMLQGHAPQNYHDSVVP
jgi:hypothetical protein